MRRQLPPDSVRCTAPARWTGGRCRKAAYGPSGLCTMHRRFPPRGPRPDPSLVSELGAFDLGEGKAIRVHLRRRRDGETFVAVRLFVDDVPTRKALYLSPRGLDGFAFALSDAAEKLARASW